MSQIDVFELAHRISIEETVSQYLKLQPKNGKLYGLCPFHNDKSVGSFVVFPDASSGKRGWFQCYSCGEKGDNIDFVKNYLGVSYREAAITICLNSGLLSQDEADVLLGRKMGTVQPKPKANPSQVKKLSQPEKKDPDHLSRVYTSFAAASKPLSPDVRELLLSKRRIPASSLSKYFMFPLRSDLSEFWGKFRKELFKEFGLSDQKQLEQILIGVPGFYLNRSGTLSFSTTSDPCIGIKIFDRMGRVSGIQTRAIGTADGNVQSKDQKKNRYKFLSSGYANGLLSNDSSQGCSCGYVEDVLYPSIRTKEKVVAITEGRFKAEILASLGFTVVNMHSIANWKPAGEVALNVARDIGASRFLLCYDCEQNDNVFASASSLYNKISSELPTGFAIWNPQNGKGIDDVIIAGHLNDISRVTAEEYFGKKAG